MKLLFLMRRRFAAKMIVAFVVVILLPILFTSASFYFVANSTLKNNVRESSVQIAEQAADSISYILNAGSDISDLIYSDLRIQNVVKKEIAEGAASLQEWREDEEYLISTLNNIVYSSSFANIVYVIKDQHQSWGSGTFSRVKLARYRVEELDFAVEARKKDGGLAWLGLQDDRFSGGGDNTELVLPVARVLKDFETMENIGYIIVNLNGRKMIEKLQQMKLGDTGGFFVVNEEGRIMIDPNVSRINRIVANADLLRNIVDHEYIEFEFQHGDTPYYGVKQRLSNGWYIVGTVPVHEITQKMDRLNQNILRFSAIFALAGIIIGSLIAKYVTRPIRELTQQMRRVQQGDLSVRSHVLSSDELGLMSRQFNQMVSEIKALMEQVQREQQQKQDAELRAVMHRINPHFLFNTLTTLRWLIKYQPEKADHGMYALIRLLEANMGKKGNFITLGEELDIIEKYLVILEMRYGKTYRLHTEIDQQAVNFTIPRMLLQPLVENAIFHGFVPKNADGDIEIYAALRGNSLEIIVMDNGVGLPEDKRAEVHTLEDAATLDRSGIGLKHVAESIMLYYGKGSSFRLEPRSSSEETVQEGQEAGETTGAKATILLCPKEPGNGGMLHAPDHDR